MEAARVLLVDFNNFSRYPTVAIGYLAAVLRQSGHEVSVFSPFAVGLKGVVREPRETSWSLLAQQARYWSSTYGWSRLVTLSTDPCERFCLLAKSGC